MQKGVFHVPPQSLFKRIGEKDRHVAELRKDIEVRFVGVEANDRCWRLLKGVGRRHTLSCKMNYAIATIAELLLLGFAAST